MRVRDNRQFGRKPLVGIHTLKSLEKFRCEPIDPDYEEDLEMPGMEVLCFLFVHCCLEFFYIYDFSISYMT